MSWKKFTRVLKNCMLIMLQKCSVCWRCCTSWKPVRFNHPLFWKVWQNRTRRAFQRVDDILSTQLALLAVMGSLGVSSASLLALPAFLGSAFGASDFLTSFSEAFEDCSITKVLEKGLSLTNDQESRLAGTPEKLDPTCLRQNRPRVDDNCSKVFNAHQDKFGSRALFLVRT